MNWEVRPSSLRGTLRIPPSKSHTIRAVLVASLADGVSTVRRPLAHGDGRSALEVARGLGAEVRVRDNGEEWEIRGTGGARGRAGGGVLDCGNSGTSARLFCAAAALGAGKWRFDGDRSLRTRPMRPLLDALTELGASYTLHQSNADIPFTISGPLVGGACRVDGISSQFVSSLLLSCPTVSNDTVVKVYNLHERPYVELTCRWLDKMDISYECSTDLTHFRIHGRQRYRPIRETVPADFSSSLFPAVAAAITGSTLTLEGLDFSDSQGDKQVFQFLEMMGAEVEREGGRVTVSGTSGLRGTTLDLDETPDALPVLAVLGCAAEGTTHLVNVAQARFKETDRISVMCAELGRMGARISEEPDGLVIHHSRLRGTTVDGREDHRVVMALAVAGLVAEGATTVTTAEAADVTYPGFVDDFVSAGAHMSPIDAGSTPRAGD